MNDDTSASGLKQDERELLARITLQIDRCSTHEHRLARRRAVLRAAATQLRLGKRAPVVLEEIRQEIPDAVATVQEPL